MKTAMQTHLFYSSVILNSTETQRYKGYPEIVFYSSVILNSTETQSLGSMSAGVFYSSVILNSTETNIDFTTMLT